MTNRKFTYEFEIFIFIKKFIKYFTNAFIIIQYYIKINICI